MAIEKATIHNLTTGEAIPVLFNPEEYSVDAGNAFAEVGIPGQSVPPIQFGRGNSRTLKMELFFDTSESHRDVRDLTRRVTGLLDKAPQLQAPPILLFAWGGFNFQCVLERVGQRFTLFTPAGVPVRAYLSTSFKEYQEAQVVIQGGLFAGPPTLRTLIGGETLSGVASQELGDPAAWRQIADANQIDNPRIVAPGTPLVLPPRPNSTRG